MSHPDPNQDYPRCRNCDEIISEEQFSKIGLCEKCTNDRF